MRSTKDLSDLVAAAIENSGGTAPFGIAATSEEEAEAIRSLLKGKHGSKAVSVEVKPASFFVSHATEWASTPAKGQIWGNK